MENIKFEITESDIKEYLKKHKDDENIKYKEAMFIKYMREQNIVTKEKLEMMFNKYNFEDNRMDGIYFYDDYDIMRSIPFRTFDDYLDGINNLDISGICHILIPALGYYGEYGKGYQIIGVPYIGLNDLSMKLIGTVPEDINRQLKYAIEDYYTVGKLDKFACGTYVNIKMGKENCRRELQEYSYIYGEEPVKIIRKSIRERM